MFKFTKKDKTELDMEIDEVMDTLRGLDVLDEDYDTVMDKLKDLYELKNKNDKFNISPDTMVVVAGNLLGILLILKHEEINVVTSKAMGFVLRGRA